MATHNEAVEKKWQDDYVASLDHATEKEVTDQPTVVVVRQGIAWGYWVLLFTILAIMTTLAITTQQRVASNTRVLGEMEQKVTELKTTQSDLKQQRDELSQYDRNYKIATEYGLKINEDQVRTIKND